METIEIKETRLVNIKELKKFVPLSERKLQSLYREGNMPCVRSGRNVLFNPKRVVDWFESGCK